MDAREAFPGQRALVRAAAVGGQKASMTERMVGGPTEVPRRVRADVDQP